MLYTQLRQIIELDRRISSMHRELDRLYQERASIVNVIPANDTPKLEVFEAPAPQESAASKRAWRSAKSDWLAYQTAELTRSWARYGFKIPTGKKFTQELERAYDVINELEALLPELAGNLGVVLVPPGKHKIFPAGQKLRAEQQFMSGADRVLLAETKQPKHRSWRTLVAYTGPTGLNWGSARDLLKNQRHQIAGYDLRALGPTEYAALTLQLNYALDMGSWTMLLNDYDGRQTAPVNAVTLVNGCYNYCGGDHDTVFGDDRFRPAVEVTL